MEYVDLPFDMLKFEDKIKYKISYKQKFIEYSPLTTKLFKDYGTKKIKRNGGGILIIDYGYTE